MTPEAAEAEREEARQSLRERGEELLRRSADVNLEEDSHPAYARILEDLAPDEARILRMLLEQGPQPVGRRPLGAPAAASRPRSWSPPGST